MVAHEVEVNAQEVQVAISIYTVLTQTYNSVPQLSVDTLFLDYYDVIKPYVTTIFDYWLLKEIVVPKTPEDKQLLLHSLSGKYQARLRDLLFRIWFYLGITFTDLTRFEKSNYVTVLNEARQGVW